MGITTIPSDILVYSICKYASNIEDIKKLRLVNMEFNKNISTSVDDIFLSTINDNIPKYIEDFELSYYDFTKSPIKNSFIDQFAGFIQKSLNIYEIVEHLYNCDKKSQENIANNNRTPSLNYLKNHAIPIFEITKSYDIYNDFKIFQFLFFLNSRFFANDNKYRIIKWYLVIQLVNFFEHIYKDFLKTICKTNTIKYLEKQFNDWNNCFMNSIYDIEKIEEIDVNLYTIYYSYISENIVRNKNYRNLFSNESIVYIKNNLLYQIDNLTSMYYSDYNYQLNTISILQILNTRDIILENIGIFTAIILFKYINYLIKEYMLSKIFLEEKVFLMETQNACIDFIEELKISRHDKDIKILAIKTFTETIENIEKII